MQNLTLVVEGRSSVHELNLFRLPLSVCADHDYLFLSTREYASKFSPRVALADTVSRLSRRVLARRLLRMVPSPQKMESDEQFMVPGWDLAVQEGSADHICALDRNLTITWTNRAWKRFASLNGGDPGMASEGCRYTDPIMPPLDGWYREHLLACLSSGNVWQHEYDCAAPLLYRRAMLMAYPVVGRALVLVHTWLVERPIDPETARPSDFEPGAYRDEAGILHQCMHCQRVRRLDPAGRWDWVSEWVAAAQPMTSHGLCEPCLDHYYPAAS